MSLRISSRYVVFAALLGCSNADYCGDRAAAVSTLASRFAPCAGDAGFDAGFSQTSCETALSGDSCSNLDRSELSDIGGTGAACANQSPTCDPATPLDQFVLYLRFTDCLADAGPAMQVSPACLGALNSVGAGY